MSAGGVCLGGRAPGSFSQRDGIREERRRDGTAWRVVWPPRGPDSPPRRGHPTRAAAEAERDAALGRRRRGPVSAANCGNRRSDNNMHFISKPHKDREDDVWLVKVTGEPGYLVRGLQRAIGVRDRIVRERGIEERRHGALRPLRPPELPLEEEEGVLRLWDLETDVALEGHAEALAGLRL